MKRHRKPPQGTGNIVNPERKEALIDWRAEGLLTAMYAKLHGEEEWQLLATAKEERNQPEMARLIKILKELYPVKIVEKVFKSF
jgi:hypothetical protein